MQKIKILVLTDHSNHSSENSLYPLAREMRKHSRCAQLDVATRGNSLNDLFFEKHMAKGLMVTKVEESFAFFPDGRSFKKNIRREYLRSYHAVWLRLPPPLSSGFLDFLRKEFPNQLIINDPEGIYKTGSKAFLINFPDLCPPMQICTSLDDIISFKRAFPIVLKPFREYGGKGIVKIDGERVWQEGKEETFEAWSKTLEGKELEYLAVKFLQNVTEGDKRIIVVKGEIMGASLRLPAPDSWLCNVSQGGRAIGAQVDEAEKAIVARVDPVLAELGIVMYGIDTLMGDEGKRILSEINATSIGGLPNIAKADGKPQLRRATDLIWEYILEKIIERDAIKQQ